jgi:hypothetical protein
MARVGNGEENFASLQTLGNGVLHGNERPHAIQDRKALFGAQSPAMSIGAGLSANGGCQLQWGRPWKGIHKIGNAALLSKCGDIRDG